MKTRNYCKIGYHLVLVLFLSLLMSSCGKEKGRGFRYPVPDGNPVYFTSDAQVKNIFVENIVWIVEENPDTDIVEKTDTGPLWIIIKNNWIKIRYGSIVPQNTLEITVKENPTSESRNYNLQVEGFPPPLAPIVLDIIQEGK